MRVRYNKANLNSAVEAATKLALAADDGRGGTRFVIATANGYTITKELPPFQQAHVVIYPDGSTMAFAYDFKAGVWECSKPGVDMPVISDNLVDVLK